jgi:hypothetical protein
MVIAVTDAAHLNSISYLLRRRRIDRRRDSKTGQIPNNGELRQYRARACD